MKKIKKMKKMRMKDEMSDDEIIGEKEEILIPILEKRDYRVFWEEKNICLFSQIR